MWKRITLVATLVAAACCAPKEAEKQKVAPTEVITGRIFVYGQKTTGVGTCFPIKIEKTDSVTKIQLLTARHVVSDSVDAPHARMIELYRLNELVYMTAEVVVLRDNKALDSALLEIEVPDGLGIQPLKLSTHPPIPGTRVWSFGCRLGLLPTFTEGLVNREYIEGDVSRKSVWIASADVFGGASGGPLVDPVTLEVVGVTSAYPVASNSFVDIPVTHVQLFIAASAIHAWLVSGQGGRK